jgi:cytoskeletal protein CcmA (bactofilin family)
MFEKHRNTRPDSPQFSTPQENPVSPASAPVSSGRAAVIGPGIHINGDISGDENLVIEGKVEGKIHLKAHVVDIGQSGQVHANITAKIIKIAGEVRGDISGMEKVVISRTGNVHGNIVAPRMNLEEGAIFKGSIDMDPGEPAKPKARKPVKTVEAKSDKQPESIKVEKDTKSAGHILNGG